MAGTGLVFLNEGKAEFGAFPRAWDLAALYMRQSKRDYQSTQERDNGLERSGGVTEESRLDRHY